ncbi:meiotic nuclear division protein 1, partial [Patellaria atrata CBS 101060]
QAPKSQPPVAKQALILTWFQKSGVAHSIKDLEKALPSIASINGMQVKDYLQALSDENRIRVEKIGSGNWYWSFPSEEKKVKEGVLEKAREERDKAATTVEELRAKVEEAGAEREYEEMDGDMLLGDGKGGDRKGLMRRYTELGKEVETLRKELAAYSDNDPVEVEKRRAQGRRLKGNAEKWTEHIQSMEDWIKGQVGGDKEQMVNIKRTYYGDEYDEEEDCLEVIEGL